MLTKIESQYLFKLLVKFDKIPNISYRFHCKFNENEIKYR